MISFPLARETAVKENTYPIGMKSIGISIVECINLVPVPERILVGWSWLRA